MMQEKKAVTACWTKCERLLAAVQNLMDATGLKGCLPAKDKSSDHEASKRWYRIHPDGEMQWHVRREAGPMGHVCADWKEVHEAAGIEHAGDLAAGGDLAAHAQRVVSMDGFTPVSLNSSSSAAEDTPRRELLSDRIRKFINREPQSDAPTGDQSVTKRPSIRKATVPNFVERRYGLEEQGFDTDAFSNICRVCYENAEEAIVLPCRHGGLCHICLRKALFSKPVHKGGRCCPFCRKLVREMLQIHRVPGEPVQFAWSMEVF